MKKLIVAIFMVTFLRLVGFAESSENCDRFNSGFSYGGYCTLEEGVCSGFGEWNIPIIRNHNGFILRDSINIGGFGIQDSVSKNTGGFFLGDKIIFGNDYSNELYSIKVYGFLGTDFYFTEDLKEHFWNKPVVFDSRLGAGFEFQYNKASAFVVEIGGKNNYVLGDSARLEYNVKEYSPFLNVGFRSYRK